MGLPSTTADDTCKRVFNTAHFVKKKISHKTLTSPSRGFLEDGPKVTEKLSGVLWGYSPIKWKACVLV